MIPNLKLLAIAALVAGALGFAGAWSWQGSRGEVKLAQANEAFQSDLRLIEGAATQANEKELATYKEKLAAVTASSASIYKEHTDGKKERDAIIGELNAAKRRLSIIAAKSSTCSNSVSANTPAGSLVHGPGRVELDGTHAARIIAITDDGDSIADMLTVCQAYIRTVAPAPPIQ